MTIAATTRETIPTPKSKQLIKIKKQYKWELSNLVESELNTVKQERMRIER